MTVLPPFQVPGAIAASFPELLMLAPTIQTAISGIVKNSAGLQPFLQIIEQQGAPSSSSGWAYIKPLSAGQSASRLELSPQTCAAIPAFMQPVLNQAMNTPELENWVWTVQPGTPPGQPADTSSIPDWEWKTRAPQGGVVFPSIKFSGNNNTFSLSCINQVVRHLGVYVEFLSGGSSVVPVGWQSRLPGGVSSAFETATVKYLGMLSPNTPVAGIDVSCLAQTFSLTLPANADAFNISFGGIGNGNWQNVTGVAGLIASFIYDYSLPLILNWAKASADQVRAWYQKIVNDRSILAAVLNAAEVLLSSSNFPSMPSVLQWLSDNTSELFLGNALAPLRKEINKQFGDGTVEKAASYLGWPAQILLALQNSQNEPGGGIAIATTSRLLALPPCFSLALSPGTLVDVLVTIKPDAEYGQWLLQSDSVTGELVYASGDRQRQQADIIPSDLSSPVTLVFGSIVNQSPFSASVSINDDAGRPVSGGTISGRLEAKARQVALSLNVSNTRPVISATTRYYHKSKLAYAGGALNWQALPAPDATLADFTANYPLSQLVGLTLQQTQSSLGYTWRTTEKGVPSCRSSGLLSHPYYIQNVGTGNVQSGLKMVNCGFAQMPALIYADSALISGPASFFLDADAGNYLRPVDLSQAGNFDLNVHEAVGQFVENNPIGGVVHPNRTAVVVNWANAKLEQVTLADRPVAEEDAPVAQALSGPGIQPGLLNGPVAAATTPDGFILVLENGGKRVQAFDGLLNPTAIFNQSAYLPLQATSGATYQDIAVAPNGCIYLLLYTGSGSAVSDYLLDIYQADGSFVSRTVGVNGARLVVDSQSVVYTLNFEALSGPGLRAQPSISKWLPQG